MSTNYSILAGVGHHADEKIGPISQAAGDAAAVAAALNSLGFEKDHQELLLDDKATASSIRYYLKQTLAAAGAEDSVYLFFSGHGFSSEGKGFLVAHDSRVGDLVGTGVSLAEVLAWIEGSHCQRVAMFLDCGQAGLVLPAKGKGLSPALADGELNQFFGSSPLRVAFGSCQGTEKSYGIDSLGHGVWSYHLIQALTGKVPAILEDDHLLRAQKLQDYLSQAVPKTLRETSTERRRQTPVFYGLSHSTFLIADLDPVLPKAGADESVVAGRVKQGFFGNRDGGPVNRLAGFDKKRHFVPDRRSNQADSFIKEIGDKMVQEEANRLFALIKLKFGYRRGDVKISADPGSAIINAKDFDLTLSMSQDAKDPGKYELEVRADKFSSPEIVHSDAFNEVFARRFSFLQLGLLADQDIVPLIDRIEEAKPPGIEISYGQEPTQVAIKIEGIRGTFEVGRDWLRVNMTSAEPREFVEALVQAQSTLLGPKTTVATLFGIGAAVLRS